MSIDSKVNEKIQSFGLVCVKGKIYQSVDKTRLSYTSLDYLVNSCLSGMGLVCINATVKEDVLKPAYVDLLKERDKSDCELSEKDIDLINHRLRNTEYVCSSLGQITKFRKDILSNIHKEIEPVDDEFFQSVLAYTKELGKRFCKHDI